jgi:type VI protein secretion system component Hcp
MKNLLLSIALLFGTFSLASAEIKYFMWFTPDRVVGDTEDAAIKEKKAAEIIAFQFQGQNSSNIGSSTDGAVGGGKVTFDRVSVILPAGSRAAVDLMREMAKGAHFDEVFIQGRRENAGGATTEIFTLALKMVVISNVALEGTRGDEPLLEVILDWGAMKFTSPGKLNPDGGTAAAPEEAMWSRVGNDFSFEVGDE